MGQIDVIYPLHNRLYYTMMTLPRVIHECREYKDCVLWIYDDNSDDGSSEFVKMILLNDFDFKINYVKKEIGNSTYCLNETIKNGEAEFIYKIDNDIIIPLGSFKAMTEVIPKDCGFLMMGESGNYPKLGKCEIINNNRTHIGGVGLFRRAAFNSAIKSNRRFFGFTQYQIEAKKRGWKCMEVDSKNTNLDMCEWYSKAKDYESKGWGRILNNIKSIWQ